MKSGDQHRVERIGRDPCTPAYRKAVEVMPSFGLHPEFVRGLLARELTIVGRPAEAIVQLQTLITLAPSNPVYPFELGQILRSQGRPEEAAAAFRKARDLNPQLWGSWDGLAAALLDLGHFAEARAATQRLLDLRAPEPKRQGQRRQQGDRARGQEGSHGDRPG